MIRYKCCGNVVVFLAFRCVALALGVVALLTSLKDASENIAERCVILACDCESPRC